MLRVPIIGSVSIGRRPHGPDGSYGVSAADTVSSVADQRVTIKLSPDEALVLMEWLYRISDRPDFKEIVPEAAERVAVWALHGNLETQSVDLFRDDYAERLAAARERLAPPGSEF
jgi:hypothetical protein